MFHLESTSVPASKGRVHISITKNHHTCLQGSSHFRKIALHKISSIDGVEYGCGHMKIGLLEFLLHLMDLYRRVPDTMNAKKSIRFEKVFCDKKLCRLSRSVRSFYDDERTRTLFSREKYLSFGFREGSILGLFLRNWHKQRILPDQYIQKPLPSQKKSSISPSDLWKKCS